MTELIPRESPHGHCIFCEDIRQEVNSKETYVGVFGGPELFVFGQLPANIGKFMIKVYYAQRRTDIIAPVTLVVRMPGDKDNEPSAQAEIDIPAIIRDIPQPAPDVDDPFLAVQLAFLFNPLELMQEGLIEVRAIRGDNSYRLGGLRVRLKPTPTVTPKEAAN